MIRNWVLHHLRIAGEAANGLSEKLIRAHAEISWSDIIGMRHVLVHQYFGIDLDAVPGLLREDVPRLREQR